MVPLRADGGTEGRPAPPGTCRVAELTVEAGEARLEAARVVTEGGERRPAVELKRTILSLSLSYDCYLAPVLTTPPGGLLEVWSVPGEPFSPWLPPPLV